MTDRLRTGVEKLDRTLGGGLPAGSVLALSADPASQVELFLYQITATRGTLWLSLNRSAEAVREGLDNTAAGTGNPTVRHISGEAPLDDVGKFVGALPEMSNLIVDPVDVLEAQESRSRFRDFLNGLRSHISDTDSLAVLLCLDGQSVPPLRDTTEYFADVVFSLETQIHDDEVSNRLAVPKFRGGRAPAGVVRLDLTEDVSIDTSRDIA